jgi:hypothetical protein
MPLCFHLENYQNCSESPDQQQKMNWPIELNDKFQGRRDLTIHKIIRWKIIRVPCIWLSTDIYCATYGNVSLKTAFD